MIAFWLATLGGLVALWWTAERFVDGAVGLAVHWRMPPLLIGMLVMGFGTSAPELVVSASAALDGSPGLALGNAIGSNVANIGLILGVTALLSPIAVQSQTLRRELPVLMAVTLLVMFQLRDGVLSGFEGWILVVALAALISWSIWHAQSGPDPLAADVGVHAEALEKAPGGVSLVRSAFQVAYGLVGLVLSAQALIWGGVGLAQLWGVSETVIGLSVVAVGTSLPELAASIAAARKGEHDLAFGNVLGSNLFNTLGVAGLAAVIADIDVDPIVLSRDMWVLLGFTASLFVVGWGWRGQPGRVNRFEASALLAAYLGYMLALGWQA